MRELFTPGLEYHARHSFTWAHAWVLGMLGEAAILEGDRAMALTRYQESLEEFHDHGDVYATIDCLITIAALAVDFGQADTSARLLGAEAAIRPRVGIRLSSMSTTTSEAVEITRARLGAEAFDLAFNEGRAVCLADAVDLALAVQPG
jgi:hypothetical protein